MIPKSVISKPGPGQRWRCSRFDGGFGPQHSAQPAGEGLCCGVRGGRRLRRCGERDSTRKRLPRTGLGPWSFPGQRVKLPRTNKASSDKSSFLGKQPEPSWAMNRASSSNKPSLLGQPIKLPRTTNQASSDKQSSFSGQAIKLPRKSDQACSDSNQSGFVGRPIKLARTTNQACSDRPGRSGPGPGPGPSGPTATGRAATRPGPPRPARPGDG